MANNVNKSVFIKADTNSRLFIIKLFKKVDQFNQKAGYSRQLLVTMFFNCG